MRRRIWRRRRPDPSILADARARLRRAEVAQEVGDALTGAADDVTADHRTILIENHVGPKFHRALGGN